MGRTLGLGRKKAVLSVLLVAPLFFTSCQRKAKKSRGPASPSSRAPATGQPLGPVGYDRFKVKLASGEAIRVEKADANRWVATQGADTWVVERASDGSVTLKKGDRLWARAKAKGAKLNFFDAKGSPYFGLVFKPKAVKVFVAGTAEPWKLKFKANKVKVVFGDVKRGKVKFYPDQGRLKAKDAQGQKVAQVRNVHGLSSVLAPFLMSGLDKDQKIFLALVLLALGK